jgi:hypothetical protein
MACCSAPSENKDRDLMPILTDKNDKAIAGMRSSPTAPILRNT